MTPRMVAAVAQPARQRPRPLHRPAGRRAAAAPARSREFDAEAVFEACARARHRGRDQLAAPSGCDPPDELIELARDLGCLFSIDSDAHAPGQLDMKAYGCERAERLGIPADRIVTTWPVERVLEWASARS